MRHQGLAAMAVVLAATLGASAASPVSKNVRVELHLTIGGEAKIWSTVQNISVRTLGGDGGGLLQSHEIDVNGGALVVHLRPDLPALLMLMRDRGSEAGYDTALATCPLNGGEGDFVPVFEKFAGTCRVASDFMPTMVTMTDLADPQTIKPLDLAALAASLGAPVTFDGVTLTATTDPVDVGILEVVPWVRKGSRPVRGIDLTLPNKNIVSLDYRAFARGIDQ